MAADNGDNNNQAALVCRLIPIFLLSLVFTVHPPGYREASAHAPVLRAKAESCIRTHTIHPDQKDRRNRGSPQYIVPCRALGNSLYALRNA